jgi:hypothetical protein
MAGICTVMMERCKSSFYRSSCIFGMKINPPTITDITAEINTAAAA